MSEIMKGKLFALPALLTMTLMSCQNPMTFHTKVNEDGSLNKSIVLEKTSGDHARDNILGVNEAHGWKVAIEKLPDSTQSKEENEFRIQFEKEFKSVDDVNKELDNPIDTLFHVHSTFEKRFRWFYTYLYYSETIRPINRFKLESPDDYFNQEDNAFIDRLPGEGKSITKADSVFLNSLNEKIGTTFVNMAIFREQYDILTKAIQQSGLDKKWVDTLNLEYIYNHIEDMKTDPQFAEKMADSLKIPLQKPKSSQLFAELSKDFNSRLAFMNFANNGKYLNIIEMPWEVVQSNADSVSGETLYWRPLVTKFAYRDYTMFAECRKLNWWAVFSSGAILALTAILFVVKKK